MKTYIDGHVGDLILWSVFVLCLTAHTIAVLVGKPDQTLAGAVLGSMDSFHLVNVCSVDVRRRGR